MEARTITPVGGNKEIKVDTRVVAATSRDIRDMMAKGQFREDLYYRLNVITIELPPLRQRLDDIPLLSKRFMDRVNEQNGTKIASISPTVIDALQQYNWPGNVRELLNVIERMMVLSDKVQLEIDDLPAYIRQGGGGRPVQGGSASPAAAAGTFAMQAAGAAANAVVSAAGAVAANLNHATLEHALSTLTLADLEEKAIAAALVRFNNNRTRAARALGISVRTLQRKLGAKNSPEEGSPPDAPDSADSVEEPAAVAEQADVATPVGSEFICRQRQFVNGLWPPGPFWGPTGAGHCCGVTRLRDFRSRSARTMFGQAARLFAGRNAPAASQADGGGWARIMS